MAGLPKASANKPADTRNNEGESTVVDTNTPALSFEDADSMPATAQLNAANNPFQEKVNELARSGRATSVLLPADKVEWARDQIRRAANNIEKGAKTRTASEGNGMERVWFSVGAKVSRPRKKN